MSYLKYLKQEQPRLGPTGPKEPWGDLKLALARLNRRYVPGTIERFSPEQERRMVEINERLDHALISGNDTRAAIAEWEAAWGRLLLGATA
jgi:hypothetical protein